MPFHNLEKVTSYSKSEIGLLAHFDGQQAHKHQISFFTSYRPSAV
jgi:hypothetical protein